jgi:hypothetical protein
MIKVSFPEGDFGIFQCFFHKAPKRTKPLKRNKKIFQNNFRYLFLIKKCMRPCYFLKSLYPVIKAVNKSMYIWSENSAGYEIFQRCTRWRTCPSALPPSGSGTYTF